GVVVNRYGYLPFGGTIVDSAPTQNPFTFVGELGVMQTAGQSYDMRARDYSPTTGQFLTVDPLGPRSGDTNLRGYVSNNPVDQLDPSGRAGAFLHLFAPNVFLTSSIPADDLAITISSPEVPQSIQSLIGQGAGNADAFAEFQGALETLGGNSAVLSGSN